MDDKEENTEEGGELDFDDLTPAEIEEIIEQEESRRDM